VKRIFIIFLVLVVSFFMIQLSSQALAGKSVNKGQVVKSTELKSQVIYMPGQEKAITSAKSQSPQNQNKANMIFRINGKAVTMALDEYVENKPDFEAALDMEVGQNPQEKSVISVIIKASCNFEVADFNIPISYPAYLEPFAEINWYEPFNQWDVVFPRAQTEKLESGEVITYITLIGWCDLGGEPNPYFRTTEDLQPIAKIDFHFNHTKAALALDNEHLIKPTRDYLLGEGIFGDKFGIHGVVVGVPERNISEITNVALGKVAGDESFLPTVFAIAQNYPNPFNARTKINYDLPQDCFVTIETFDILGRKVATLVSEQLPAGYHTVIWNASDIPSGLYFYRITAGNFVQTKKMALIK